MEQNEILALIFSPRRHRVKRERSVKKTPKPGVATRYVKPHCLRVFENEYNAAYYTGRMANIPVECRALYRFSGSTNGMTDVTAIVGGKHVSLEIKHGHDKPRQAQLNVQRQVQQAGGIYEFVHTFEEFLQLMHGHGLIETTLFNSYFE